MSRILRINDGDYKIKVQPAGTIILDTSPIRFGPDAQTIANPEQQGQVIITGNLIVQGETTTVNTTQMTVEDRVITLNSGETSDGISDLLNPLIRESGLEISRGTRPWAEIKFDETRQYYSPAIIDNERQGVTTGTFVLKFANGQLAGLRANSITTEGEDLVLLGKNTEEMPYANPQVREVVSVRGTTDYENQVVDKEFEHYPPQHDDIIPNIKAVQEFVFQHAEVSPPWKIQDFYRNFEDLSVTRYDTWLEINDSQRPQVDATDHFSARPTVSASHLVLKIDGAWNAHWYTDRFEVQEIKVSDNVIECTTPNTDLVLKSTTTAEQPIRPGSVAVDSTLKLKLVQYDPYVSHPRDKNGEDEVPNYILGPKIYAKQESAGGTGIFFVNTRVQPDEELGVTESMANTLTTRDELASRRKAFAFSMIF